MFLGFKICPRDSRQSGGIEKLADNKKTSGNSTPVTINECVNLALGRYVVRVNSADYVHRNFLFIMKLFLDANRHYQAVAMDYLKVNEFENSFGMTNCFEEQISFGIMYRKECLKEAGLDDTEFQQTEGNQLRVCFEKKFKIGRLEFPLYRYSTR